MDLTDLRLEWPGLDPEGGEEAAGEEGYEGVLSVELRGAAAKLLLELEFRRPPPPPPPAAKSSALALSAAEEPLGE